MSKICILTGQPGSGKTTIANKIVDKSEEKWFIIDGDDIRAIFDNKDYTRKGREKNIELSHNIAKYLTSKNENVIISLVSPYREFRNELKKLYDNVLEVYVYTDEIRGREHYFCDDYEEPISNFLEICTNNVSIDSCAYEILIKFKDYTNQ